MSLCKFLLISQNNPRWQKISFPLYGSADWGFPSFGSLPSVMQLLWTSPSKSQVHDFNHHIFLVLLGLLLYVSNTFALIIPFLNFHSSLWKKIQISFERRFSVLSQLTWNRWFTPILYPQIFPKHLVHFAHFIRYCIFWTIRCTPPQFGRKMEVRFIIRM